MALDSCYRFIYLKNPVIRNTFVHKFLRPNGHVVAARQKKSLWVLKRTKDVHKLRFLNLFASLQPPDTLWSALRRPSVPIGSMPLPKSVSLIANSRFLKSIEPCLFRPTFRCVLTGSFLFLTLLVSCTADGPDPDQVFSAATALTFFGSFFVEVFCIFRKNRWRNLRLYFGSQF